MLIYLIIFVIHGLRIFDVLNYRRSGKKKNVCNDEKHAVDAIYGQTFFEVSP